MTRHDPPVLLVPRLEAARVQERPDVFTLETWEEHQDPLARVATLTGPAEVIAIDDHATARVLLALQAALPRARFVSAGRITTPLRVQKDEGEISRLQAAARGRRRDRGRTAQPTRSRGVRSGRSNAR